MEGEKVRRMGNEKWSVRNRERELGRRCNADTDERKEKEERRNKREGGKRSEERQEGQRALIIKLESAR